VHQPILIDIWLDVFARGPMMEESIINVSLLDAHNLEMPDLMTSRKKSPAKANPASQRLESLRESVLALHKTLIDAERTAYEQAFGTVESQSKFIQLLISDPWFAWLHPISELVIAMDEALEAEEPVTMDQVKHLADKTRALLKASEEGQGFERSYFEALQREPDVVLAHSEVTKRLNPG
jgi:hypothetical protein